MKPISDRVLVRRDKPEKESKGGILLPEQSQNKTQQGTVVAVGPGKVNDKGLIQPMSIQKGERVVWARYAGNEVPQDDELVFLREEDILAVIEAVAPVTKGKA